MPAILRLRLGGQLMTAMGALALGFVGYGLWSYNVLEEQRIGSPLYHHIVDDKNLLADIEPPAMFIVEAYLTTLQMVQSPSRAERETLAARLAHLETEYGERSRYWRGQHLTADMGNALERSDAPAWRFFQAVHARLEPALASDDSAAVVAAMRELGVAYSEHRNEIDNALRLAAEENVASENTAAAHLALARIGLAAVFCVSLATGMGLLYVTTRGVVRDTRRLTQNMQRIAQGDFTVATTLDRADELGDMAAAMEQTRHDLAALVGGVKKEANHVTASSNVLSQAADAVARGVADHSDATLSMAAAVEELSTSIAAIGAVAERARKISRVVGDHSSAGREAMQLTAEQIRDVSDRIQGSAADVRQLSATGESISRIVTVIRDIAEQTNLLALNAAIEAARAGEQGRGFAVVADEVRNLAARTAVSTEEISDMITAMHSGTNKVVDSISRVSAFSLETVEAANRATRSLSDGIADLEQLVVESAQISESLLEQRAASEDLARSVEQVAEVTRQNQAATDNIAQTSHDLAAMARALETAVVRFKTA